MVDVPPKKWEHEAMIEHLPDAELVERFRRGDPAERAEVFLALYRRYQRLILTVCYHYLKDYELARDIFHDAFIKIMENLDTIADPAIFRGWAVTIARNLCVDHLRRSSLLKEEQERVMRIIPAYGARIEEKYIREIDRRALSTHLRECVGQLASADRNIFRLRCQGERAAEIGRLLQVDRADMRRAYDRIRKVLETCMARKGFKIAIEEMVGWGDVHEAD